MKQKITRNIAIVSAIFALTFAIMLVTNYLQLIETTPLQSEILETLKQLNYEYTDNSVLQEHIRSLDLLARKAYFISHDRLQTGIVILVLMIAIFIISVQIYYVKEKNIPEKQIYSVDEWALKTLSRKYITVIACIIGVISLLFAFLSSPYLKTKYSDETIIDLHINDNITVFQDNADFSNDDYTSSTFNNFRGNNSLGVSSAKNIPANWNLKTKENILWQNDILRHGYNSPVISNNKVFITGADNQTRELFCYDLSTGKLLWTLEAKGISGSPTEMPETTEDTGLAASTAATNGKQVCAIFATGDLICADMDGKKLWTKNLGVPDNHYGYASSLLISGNMLFVQYDNSNERKVIAIDVTTGAEKWSKTRADKIAWCSPIMTYINNMPQLVLMGNPSITAYNPINGEQLWRVACMSGEVSSSPCSSGGIIFGGSEYATLIAIDASNGNTLWKTNEHLPEVSSPVATNDYVFIATSYGVVACYDTKNGNMLNTIDLKDEFYSSPILVDEKIYLFSNEGKMHIFTANSDMTIINSFETGEKTFSTPAFTDNKIIVRTEKSIYCVVTK